MSFIHSAYSADARSGLSQDRAGGHIRRAAPAGVRSLTRLAAAAAVVGLWAGIARAADYAWTGGSSGDGWSLGGNWQGGTAPPSDAATRLMFAGTQRLTPAQDITSPFVLNVLAFDATAGAYVVGGGPLEFRASPAAVGPTLASVATVGVRVNNTITLTNTLSVSGGPGGVTFGGPVGGAGGLTTTGPGVVTLAAANTYAGDTDVDGGGAVTVAAGGSLANSLVGVRAGGTFNVGPGAAVNPVTPAFVRVGGAGAATATVNLTGGAISSTETDIGGVDGSTSVFNHTAGTHAVDSGFHLGTSPGSFGTYNLGGDATSVLSVTRGAYIGYEGTGTFNQTGGVFTTNGSQLSFSFINGAGTYNLRGGVLAVGVIRGFPTSGDTFLNLDGGTLRIDADRPSSSPAIVGLRRINVQAGGAKVDTNGHAVFLGQILRHDEALGARPDGGLTKLGAGTLTLTNSNTFTGGVTVAAGTLSVDVDGRLGDPAGAVTLTGGTLLYTTNSTTRRVFNLNSSPLTAGDGIFVSYLGATLNGGTLAGGGEHRLGDGTRLNGTRTTTGTTLTHPAGTVTFNNVTLGGTSTFTQSAGAVLNTTGEFILNTQAAATISGTTNTAGGSTLGSLTITNGGVLNQSGPVPLSLDGGRGTTVNPGGTLAAAAGSSIELGGLLVNNGTQTGALNVNLGGVAKGSGTFGAVAVADGGRFAPGNSPGRATVGALAFGPGGRFDFELNSAHATPGDGADFIDDLGVLSITAGSTAPTQFTVAVISLDANNGPAPLADFDPAQSYRFTLLAAAGGISGFDPGRFVVDVGGFRNDLRGGRFAVEQDGGNLVLAYTPVPEPGAGVGLAGGLGLLLARRQRRLHS